MSSEYKYKYEIHMHTKQGSKCGKTPAAEYVSVFKELGYDGIIITDHFFYGNTAVDRSLPWPDFIEEFCKGYEEAKAEGDRQGLKVFFGFEACRRPDEYLIYGVDKDWLKAHPEIRDADHIQQYKLIQEAGGCIVGAHPFRERGYIDHVRLHPYQCDAWEACNFGNPPYQDAFAYQYCADHNILMTSGSDLHDKELLSASPCGMLFEKPLESIQDFVKAIKSGTGFVPMIPEDRKHITPDMVNTLPIELYDEKNIGKYLELKDIFG